MMDSYLRKYIQPLIDRIAKVLLLIHLTPIHVTIIALFIGLSAAVMLYLGYHLIAVALLWLSGLSDAVDGSMARLSDQSSSLGTLLDITFDRLVEIGIIIVFALLYTEIRLHLIFLLSSILTSITIFLSAGAAAERKGEKSFYYQPGLAERSEGLVFLSFMMLFPQYAGHIAIGFTAIICITIIQRFVEAIKLLS